MEPVFLSPEVCIPSKQQHRNHMHKSTSSLPVARPVRRTKPCPLLGVGCKYFYLSMLDDLVDLCREERVCHHPCDTLV